MSVHFVYLTAKDRKSALKLARQLVKEKYLACANIIDGATSVYHWQGKVEESKECLIIGKTSKPKLAGLIRRAKALHSYDCPCVVAIPIAAGNKDYLKWVEKSLV
ncbi:MAG: divalent-cation tolerance protein CutA [Dongiaceae bacterium]